MAEPDRTAQRKQLLVARSALCRLRLRHDVMVLRESFTGTRAVSAIAGSRAGRSAAFLVAVEILGVERMDTLLATARRTLAIARIARIAFEWLRRPAAEAADPPPPPAS
jgi:hypothetical protein